MNVGGCEKNVDARVRGSLQRLPGPVHVARTSAGQTGDDGTPHRGRDALYGFEVAIGGDGESGLDHVHAEAVELLGQVQLFRHIHTAARRLLAVTKRGVENGDARPIHGLSTSRNDVFSTLSVRRGERKGYYLYIMIRIMILLDMLMNNVIIVILSEPKDPCIPPSQQLHRSFASLRMTTSVRPEVKADT